MAPSLTLPISSRSHPPEPDFREIDQDDRFEGGARLDLSDETVTGSLRQRGYS
jgi:hypothetical protein